MKYFISLVLVVLLGTTVYAFTPSDSLKIYLDGKVTYYEEQIELFGEEKRENLLSTFDTIVNLGPSKNYRGLDKDLFEYVLGFFIENLQDPTNKVLTKEDFNNKYDGFEIVQYRDQLVATVINTGPLGQKNDDSFENLADFIFGNNSDNSSIAMTSPVTRTQLNYNTYETAFIMPSGWTLDSLPNPNNARIQIKTIPGSLKAVRKFSGWVSQEKVAKERELFQTDLISEGIDRYGLPTLSQYDGPRVSGSKRRNELSVELQNPLQ